MVSPTPSYTPSYTQSSAPGLIARAACDKKWARWFAIVAVVQAVILIPLEGAIVHLHEQDSQKLGPAQWERRTLFRSVLVYHVLFIMAHLFQQVMVFDALRAHNLIQIIAVTGFNVLIFAYSVVQCAQTYNLYGGSDDVVRWEPANLVAVSAVEYVVVALMLVFTAALAVLSFKLYREFGWSIYKRIGADLRMRDIYKNYLILVLFIKLDVAFFFGFSLQFVILAIEVSDRLLHICSVIGAAVVLLVSIGVGLRNENKLAMRVFLAGSVPTLGYMLYRLLSAFTEARFAKFRIFITLFLVCAIATSLVTTWLAWRALRNFNKGLLTHLKAQRSGDSSTSLPDMRAGGIVSDAGSSRRWSID